MSISYPWLYEYALRRKGSIQELEASLPVPLTEEQLTAIPDDRYLADPAYLRAGCATPWWTPAGQPSRSFGLRSREDGAVERRAPERHMQNKALIRHLGKLPAFRARLILDISREHGGFGFLAQWPVDDIVGLWFLLRKRGYQLGGYSTPGFLRMAGKDTFLITTDVVAALIARGVIDRQPTSQGTLRDMQKAFNQLHQSSGRPLCQLSAMLAWTVNHD